MKVTRVTVGYAGTRRATSEHEYDVTYTAQVEKGERWQNVTASLIDSAIHDRDLVCGDSDDDIVLDVALSNMPF